MNTRNYELMLVLSPELDESALEALIDRIKRFLDNAQAQVLSFKTWGLRRLAYVIQGNREGRYYLVHFVADPENCNELERSIILTEGILRHLLTRTEVIPADEPAVADDVAPAVADDVAPAVVDDVAPAVVDDIAPAVADDVAPAVVDDVAPAVVDDIAPAVVDDVAPAVADDVAPAVVDDVAPAVADDVASAVVDDVASEEPVVESDEPVQEDDGTTSESD